MINKKIYINQYEDEYLKEMETMSILFDEVADQYKNFEEKMRLPDLLGKTLKVSESQFKEVYEIAIDICNKINMRVPHIYIYEDVYYRVESIGVENPWIELSSNVIENFTKDELVFMLAKEICDIHLGHTYYQTLIDEAMKVYRKHNKMPFSNIMNDSIYINMCRWSRVSNYTSDNFAYMMCKNIDSCINAILKSIFNSNFMINNINISEFIKQGESLNLLNDSIYNNAKLDERIPYGPYRIKNIIAYASSDRGMKAKNIVRQ